MSVMDRKRRGPRYPGIEHQEPPVEHEDVEIESSVPERDDRYVWPDGKPLPATYLKLRPLPCPKCRRVRMDDMGQAVSTRAVNTGVAYLRCRICEHTWKLPIELL